MKLRTFFLLWISTFIFISSLIAQGVTITVSPNGDDKWAGTETAPLKTLQAARDKIRTLQNHLNSSDTIKVIVKEGTYHLAETFNLDPRDSGSSFAPVVYEAGHGEKAIFSGGVTLEGFRELDNGLWAAHIPEVGYWNWTFNQLFVNGKRAMRAKSPNQGYFYMKDMTEEIWVQGTGRHPERARQVVVTDTETADELDDMSEEVLNEVIMTVYHKWNITKRHIDKFDTATHTIYTSGEGMKPWNVWAPGKRFILENHLNALDTPGEWFLDKKGTLYYMPFPDEKIETTTFIAPVLEQLLRIDGDAEKGSLVENIIFRNLHFQHAANYLPKEGFEPYQAAITIDAAIELNGAKNISFIDCSLEHTGGYGIWMNQGVSHSQFIRCYIHDLGAGGIRIGEIIMREDSALQTHSNTLDNCIISSGGFDYPTAVGVLIGHSANNHVTHNDISDFRYTGVSVGWVWGYADSQAKGNKILYNHIHHIGWGILSDMAGVYTLGISEGTEVSHNHVHHIYAYDYGGWGLYTDEGSSHIVLENNLVHHTKTGGFHQHYGRENILRNNIFAFSKMYQLQATRVEEHKSFSFNNNIVIYDRGVLYQGPWTKMQVEIDRNIYWNINGEVNFMGNILKNWQQNGYDLRSFIIDPQFNNPVSGDFTFKNLKSVRKIGFKPFDYTLCGVYGSETWKSKAKLPESLLMEFDKLFE